MSAQRTSLGAAADPHRYHESIDDALGPVATSEPVCLYLETTNRCNLLCATCPRTYAHLEPAADMSWELFTRIVDQVPNIARVVLHGVGEPMLVKELPRMVRGYGNYTLGDATQETLRAIWNGPAYQRFRAALHSDQPPKSCASCGLRWSL